MSPDCIVFVVVDGDWDSGWFLWVGAQRLPLFHLVGSNAEVLSEVVKRCAVPSYSSIQFAVSGFVERVGGG